jgi:hypothetical protein
MTCNFPSYRSFAEYFVILGKHTQWHRLFCVQGGNHPTREVMNIKKQFTKRYLLVGICLAAVIILLNVTAEEEPKETVSVEPQLLQAKMINTTGPTRNHTFYVKVVR